MTALAVTFTLGVVTGWVLNSFTRKSLDNMLSKMHDRIKKM